MKTTAAPETWSAAKTGNHQGLIIAEGTGRTVAVCYDKKDSNLIAAAPELFAALVLLKEWGCTHTSPRDGNSPHLLLIQAHEAIAKATDPKT